MAFLLAFFKKNMTLNRIIANIDNDIERISGAPVLNLPRVVTAHETLASSGDSFPTVKELYDRYGLFFFKNYTGEYIINIVPPYSLKYIARVNDVIVYSRLVQANLELRLMDDRPADMAEALARLGPESWNPYTGRPFDWDREKNILWAERASRSQAASGEPSGGWMKVRPPASRP